VVAERLDLTLRLAGFAKLRIWFVGLQCNTSAPTVESQIVLRLVFNSGTLKIQTITAAFTSSIDMTKSANASGIFQFRK
jgi:hypothetical protein